MPNCSRRNAPFGEQTARVFEHGIGADSDLDKRQSSRWGLSMDVGGGTKEFFSEGWEATKTVRESLEGFDAFEADELDQLVQWANHKAQRLKEQGRSADAALVAALRAYTEDSSLVPKLLEGCQQPLEDLPDGARHFLYHLEAALTELSPFEGDVFRACGASVDGYQVDAVVTWQAPASASKSQLVPVDCLVRDGLQLSGSYFVVRSVSAVDVSDFSRWPDEGEVVFAANSQLKVARRLESQQEKVAALPDLAVYDLAAVDVLVLEEL